MLNSKYGEIIDFEKFANDTVLTEPSDGRIFDYHNMLKLVNKLGRPLTDKEAERFRIK